MARTTNKKASVLFTVGALALVASTLTGPALAQSRDGDRGRPGVIQQPPRENARVDLGSQIRAQREAQRAQQQQRPSRSNDGPRGGNWQRGDGRGAGQAQGQVPGQGQTGRPGWGNRDGNGWQRGDNRGPDRSPNRNRDPGWRGDNGDRRGTDDRWRNPDRTGDERGRGDTRWQNRGDERWRGDNRRDDNRWSGDSRWSGDNRWQGGDRRGNDNRWQNVDRWRGGENSRRWDRNSWRRDTRYDWQSYRDRNRSAYRIGRYYAPYQNYSYRRLGVGFSLGSSFYGNRYWINDPWQYRLPAVYGPYRWVRYYDDVLLVDIYSGEVVDMIYDFFWR